MSSMYNLYIPLCSLALSLFLIALFLTKVKGYRHTENKFYFIMIIDVFVMTVMCLLAIHSIYKGYSDSFLVSLANRLECFAIFNYVSSLYMYIVSYCNIKLKENSKFYSVTNVIAFMLIMFLPISLDINKELTYMVVVGSAVNLTVLLSAIFIILMFVIVIKNYKLLKEKVIPVILLTVFLAFIMIIRQVVPEFICLEFLINLATLIMYHTIENPDLQIVEEYREIKEIAQKQNIDKVMFLHNITQSLKYDLFDIERNCQYLGQVLDLDDYKDCVNDINYKTKKMLNNLTKIYDPNFINESEIKPYNDNYETKSYESIFRSYRSLIPKNISYSYKIDANIPEYLYGDILNIKEILKKIVKGIINNIKEGSIKINLSTIIDNNVCRLIITFSYNGEGYTYKQVDESLKKGIFKQYNDDLSNVNGIFIINSEKNVKTEQIVVLDQLIVLKDTKKIEKLEHNSHKKKVMIVDNSEASKEIMKVMKNYDVELVNVSYGVDCLNKMRDYEKYHLLIINDEIEPMSGIETYKKLKENVVFNSQVIMLSKKIDFKTKEEYLRLGIKDIVSIPIAKEELKSILDKYLQE